MPLLQEAASWFKRRYGIDINPVTEALTLLGSQEGLAHLLLAVCDHGDTVLTTNPAYPSYFGAIQVAGDRSGSNANTLWHRGQT
jgi:aspartate/methionine/tyrosine aminotransferase